MKEASLALVETAGGPGSPGPSGSLQVLPFALLTQHLSMMIHCLQNNLENTHVKNASSVRYA